MKTVIYIRIAAVLTLIHAILHTIGGVFGTIDPGPEAVAVAAMKSNQFAAMGSMRTFWDFYMGLGLAATLSLTLEAIVLWMLASFSRNHANELRPILIVFALSYVVFAMISYRYFFFGPVIAELLIALCLVAATISARNKAETATA